jgi:hypothetical protein
MSETTTTTEIIETPAPAVVEQPEIQTEVPEAVQADEPKPEPEPKPKPKQSDRRFAHLTARIDAEARRAEEAERRATAAEALLNARGNGEDDAPPKPRATASHPDSVEAAAERLIAQRAQASRLAEIDRSGKAEFGAEAWDEAKSTMTMLQASTNDKFLEALAETDNPHKIFAALAEDPDTLVTLLAETPAKIAAKLVKMDSKMSAPAPKPVVSSAPKPAAPITQGAALKEINPFDDDQVKGMPMSEWNQWFEKSPLAKKYLGRRF